MRVYLDNCCYNRPFDEQGQLAVRLETEAKLAIQAMMRTQAVEYVWSDMLVSEIEESPFWDRQERIMAWAEGAADYVELTPAIESNAEDIMDLGVKSADALHLASAAAAGCDWFFTVDRGILKKLDRIGKMRIANPIDYIREIST